MKKNLIRRKKRKGFTLIELLAVILILGIIALIAIPTVSRVVEQSRKGAFETTVKNLEDTITRTCTSEMLDNKDITKFYYLDENGSNHSIDIKGDLPSKGYISVNDKCEVSIFAKENNYIVAKAFEDDEIKFYDSVDEIVLRLFEITDEENAELGEIKEFYLSTNIPFDNVFLSHKDELVAKGFEYDYFKQNITLLTVYTYYDNPSGYAGGFLFSVKNDDADLDRIVKNYQILCNTISSPNNKAPIKKYIFEINGNTTLFYPVRVLFSSFSRSKFDTLLSNLSDKIIYSYIR